MTTKNRFFSHLNYRNVLFALLGSAIIAFGTYNIHFNSHIPDGGIIGLCLLIQHFTGITPAISNIVITFFCYSLAWRLMGTRFILNTSIATIGFSAFYALFSAFPPVIPSLEQYPLLAALVGAIFVEIGTGITLRYGSAPTGEHALSMAIVKKGGFDFGWVHFLKDFVVIVLSFSYIKDIYTIVYALIIMTITTPLTEYIVNAPRRSSVSTRLTQKKRNWIPILITGLVIAIIFSGCAIYLNTYSHADTDAIAKFQVEGVSEKVLEKDVIAYVPEGEIKAGFVFYPGAKVEYTAYAPLLKACAEKGIACILVKMPYNLAILGINKGVALTEYFPDIKDWYIGGHSLGGNIAANCAANHKDIFKGVILLGSYSTTDISSLRVLSVLASNDKIINTKNYDKYMDCLPQVFTERTIIGGNHSNFGMYDLQKGDGEATIEPEKQIRLTAQHIFEFIVE